MIGHGHEGFITEVLQLFGIFIENLARWRQLDRLSGAIEEAIAILLLELTNLCADRRLRPEDLLPRPRETALPGHFQKRDELIEVHFV